MSSSAVLRPKDPNIVGTANTTQQMRKKPTVTEVSSPEQQTSSEPTSTHGNEGSDDHQVQPPVPPQMIDIEKDPFFSGAILYCILYV